MRENAYRLIVVLISAGLLVNVPLPAAAQQSTAPAAQSAVQAQSQNGPIAVPAPPQAAVQQKQRPGVIRTQSNLVRLDVEVTDHSGKPVKGLKADQFVVTDNGKAQKISTFTYEDIESIQTASTADSTPIVVPLDSPTPAPEDKVADQTRDRRMMVLFFDISSMETDDLLRARDAAKKFVEKQMTPADLVSVVVYSQKLSVWCDFTNQHDKLEQAIAHLTPGVAGQLADNLYATPQDGAEDIQQYTGDAYTADETEFNVFNTDEKLAAIEGLANALSAIPGRKNVIQFTGGITQTGQENSTEVRAATDAANLADVSIYSVDARGLYTTPPGGDATANASSGTAMFSGSAVFRQTDDRQNSRDTLATLSSDTGGRAFYDLGDLSDALPQIQKENNGYYLVGYYVGSDVKRDGKWRSIHVKVKAPKVHVRFRNGYYAPRDFQHLQKEDREQQLDDAMNSQNPIVELPIAVETAMFRLSDSQVYVPISAKLSSSALEWAKKHDRHDAAFDFAAEVRAAPWGRSVAELRDTITVQLDSQRYQQVSQSNLVYQGGVVLSPGNYHLKFLVRENESGKIGTFEEDIAIPAAQPSHMTLSSVMLSNQLVPVAKSSEVQTKAQGLRAKLSSTPLEMNGSRIIPSVTRFFTQQQTLYVFFQAYYPEKVEKGQTFDPQTLRAALIFFRNGMQVNITPMLTPAGLDAKTHTASFRISLPLAKLPTGRYAVQAVVVAPGTQQSAFGRTYLALDKAPATPAAASSSPATPAAAPSKPTTP
ncbi:MAG TPA: VWA domain-containing protein [Candidatus Acidoferrales bacterium]|nr:VWA domain-containing protein [Candidatus Acidoferrales bacterium]